MDDLVRRKDVIDALHGLAHRFEDPEDWCILEGEAEFVVSKLPSARPERIRGYWKPYTMSEITGYDPTLSGNDPVGVYCCSVCGCDAYLGEDGKDLLTDFCPNCGADMRGEQDVG